nr:MULTISPECIES: EVE domain-containing protein [Myxococcaceae]
MGPRGGAQAGGGERGQYARARALRGGAAVRAWVGVVSRSHVQRGVAGGFAQLCHGRAEALRRMSVGDWLVYYSPRTDMQEGEPLKAFTALGRVEGEGVEQVDLGGDFRPYRRRIAYLPVRREAKVDALAARLAFIREHPNWGMLARRGHFEIPLEDLALIAGALGVQAP